MPRAHRACPSCSALNHVRKLSCGCGFVFPKKVKPERIITPVSSPANNSDSQCVPPTVIDNSLYRHMNELTNYVGTLEKELDKLKENYDKRIAEIENKWRKFYNYRAQAIYQQAFAYFGGKGDLYYTKEHGDNPKLFKPIADEDGVFIPPPINDEEYADLPAGEPSDEKMMEVIEGLLTTREPLESDLENGGRIVDDIMSFTYG